MAERLLVVAVLPFVSARLRDEAIVKLDGIAQMTLKQEPGTSKYSICVPREDDDKTVYVLEEYTDKASMDKHMAAELVKDINQWITENKAVGEGASLREHQYLTGGFRFDRPEVLQNSDPHILFAELDYIPGGLETSIQYWKAVVDTGRDQEPGTLVYGVLRDTTQKLRLNTIEAYESPAYLRDVHVPSKAIEESIKNTKHLRTGLKHHALKMVAGYLYKAV